MNGLVSDRATSGVVATPELHDREAAMTAALNAGRRRAELEALTEPWTS